MKKTVKKLIIFASITGLMTYSGYNLATNINKPTICEVDHNNIYMMEENRDYIVAHRGLSSVFVENSYDAVYAAFNDDAVGTVEIDVQLTKDDEIILLHDSHVDSLTNGNGNVKNLDLNYIKNLDYFSRSLPEYTKILARRNMEDREYLKQRGLLTSIATLDDILDIDTDKTLLIDIKFDNDNANRLIAELTKKISEYDGNINFVFQSTNGKYLKALKEFLPDYEYQIIISNMNSYNKYFNEFDHFAIKHTIVNEDMIKNIYNQNKTLSVWTIADKTQFDNIYSMSINYSDNVTYISDYPDCISYWLGNNMNCQNEKGPCLTKKRDK